MKSTSKIRFYLMSSNFTIAYLQPVLITSWTVHPRVKIWLPIHESCLVSSVTSYLLLPPWTHSFCPTCISPIISITSTNCFIYMCKIFYYLGKTKGYDLKRWMRHFLFSYTFSHRSTSQILGLKDARQWSSTKKLFLPKSTFTIWF